MKTNIVSMKPSCGKGRGIENRQYTNCISLGWCCGVACSMNRYGLRSHSGPFDWCFSDFESVLKVIEADFGDFMVKENLFVDANDVTLLRDLKYGFLCPHEIKHDFEKEYEEIYHKYRRRVEQFMKDIKQPTLFIRAVKSEKEISYIEENKEYIYEIIKRGHSGNEIIFLTLNTMKRLPDCFLQFKLGLEQYSSKVYDLRTLFDSSEELYGYIKDILPCDLIERNKRFYRKHLDVETKISILMHNLDSFMIESVLKEFYSDIGQGIYLFGAGTYGELASLHLIKKGITLKGIIDNNCEKQGKICNGIPIISLSQIEDAVQNIFVTVEDKITTEIVKQILERYPNAKILTLSKVVSNFVGESESMLAGR